MAREILEVLDVNNDMMYININNIVGYYQEGRYIKLVLSSDKTYTLETNVFGSWVLPSFINFIYEEGGRSLTGNDSFSLPLETIRREMSFAIKTTYNELCREFRVRKEEIKSLGTDGDSDPLVPPMGVIQSSISDIAILNSMVLVYKENAAILNLKDKHGPVSIKVDHALVQYGGADAISRVLTSKDYDLIVSNVSKKETRFEGIDLEIVREW